MRSSLPILLLCPTVALASAPLEVFDRNVALGLRPGRGQIAVAWRQGADLDAIERAAAAAGCGLDHRWGRAAIATFRCDPTLDPRRLVAALAQAPGVTTAQVPFPAAFTAVPNDLTDRQWHHRNTGQRIAGTGGLAGADIGSIAAWGVTTGGPSVIVAVPDTGVYLDHAELQGRIAINDAEICGNGVDDDGNGYIDDCAGWDFGDGDADPDPRKLPALMPSGAPCPAIHGTFIAGLIAGATDNGTGVAGLIWDGRILPLKLPRDADCGLSDLAIAEALTYAADRGARVINVSWSFEGFSPVLASTFADLDAAGVLFPMAAGNDNRDLDALDLLPLRYDLRHKIVVAATDNRDRRASFSNWGRTTVDLGAPGWELWSAGVSGPTAHVGGSGTSYAAPLVAGVAALLWSEWPELRAREVRQAILDGARPIPGLDCATSARCVATGARLDAAGALVEAEWWATAPQLALTGVAVDDAAGGDGDGVLERGESARLLLHLRNDGHGPAVGAVLTLTWDHPHLSEPPAPIALAGIPPAASAIADVPVEVALACLEDRVVQVSVTLVDSSTGAGLETSFDLIIPCLIDDDADGWLYPEDCDDHDPAIHPGADERCNGVDDDCDGLVDNDAIDATDWYPDADGDGFGVPGEPERACEPPHGYGEGTADCDDTDPTIYPGAPEVCDGRDNDCDGRVDADATDARTFYEDKDGDGWGGERSYQACAPEPGSTDRPGDCDDDDPLAWPGSATHDEQCRRRPRRGCATAPVGVTPWGLALLLGLGALRRRS
jgi:subtilisin family serine protease